MCAPVAQEQWAVEAAGLQMALQAALLGLQRLPNLAVVAPHAHGAPPSRATLLCAVARCVALAANLELQATSKNRKNRTLPLSEPLSDPNPLPNLNPNPNPKANPTFNQSRHFRRASGSRHTGRFPSISQNRARQNVCGCRCYLSAGSRWRQTK